jgi:putative transposase
LGPEQLLTAEWCKIVLQDAIANFGKPEIINADRGTQYTSALWTQYLEEQKIQISMDGKRRATDNIWIERFWKSVKYDYVYLNPAEDGFELYQGIEEYMAYHNEKIHHTTRQSPNQRYQNPIQKAA